MFNHLKTERGLKEEAIPEAQKMVEAEVLMSDTPLALAKCAAGQHQNLQTDTKECSTADAVALLSAQCEMVAQARGQAKLSDDELFVVLKQLGIVKESKLPKPKKPSSKPVDQQLVCELPISPGHQISHSQSEYFTNIYRPLAFMVSVAVNMGVQQTLVARIREVNGDEADEYTEVFKPRMVKDHGAGLVKTDMEEFVTWITTSNRNALAGKHHFIRQLAQLRHRRYATFHVMCPDGRVPVENSMLFFTPNRCQIFHSQEPLTTFRS